MDAREVKAMTKKSSGYTEVWSERKRLSRRIRVEAILVITFPAFSGWFRHESHITYEDGEQKEMLFDSVAGAIDAATTLHDKYPELRITVSGPDKVGLYE